MSWSRSKKQRHFYVPRKKVPNEHDFYSKGEKNEPKSTNTPYQHHHSPGDSFTGGSLRLAGPTHRIKITMHQPGCLCGAFIQWPHEQHFHKQIHQHF
jgi:hypothetical protein